MDVELAVRGDRVIVKTHDQTEITRPSGLIAVSAYSPDVIGVVVAMGDGICEDIRVGDVVLFTPTSGQVMEYEGDRYLVLHEDELLAIWHEDQPAA